MTISTGDWLLADRDGVVIVPADQLTPVLAAAMDRERKETRMRDAIGQGMANRASYLDMVDALLMCQPSRSP